MTVVPTVQPVLFFVSVDVMSIGNDAPSVPELPLEPEVPLDPELPLEPDEPALPEIPLLPEVPLEPELPDVPEVPAAPTNVSFVTLYVTVSAALFITKYTPVVFPV